jgi:hypothetical protein
VDKNIWKVQTHEARGHEATKQAWVHWEEPSQEEQRGP